ncbi:Uncharacterised protein [Segatella copri]|nr:Uncharacterised protein [Segatella copri]
MVITDNCCGCSGWFLLAQVIGGTNDGYGLKRWVKSRIPCLLSRRNLFLKNAYPIPRFRI